MKFRLKWFQPSLILSSLCLLDQIIHEGNWDSNFVEINISWISFWLKSYPKQFAGHLWNTTKKIPQASWISLLWSLAVIYINLLISITCHPDLHSEISSVFSLYSGQISSGSNKKGFLRCTPGNGPHNSKITISSWRPEKVLWKPATRRWSSSTRIIKHDCYALPVSKRAFWRIFWAKGQRYPSVAKPLLELGQP